MASSSSDVVTIGDVEAQQHNPNWFVNHKHMLRSNQEGEVNELGCSILKVPEYTRQPTKDFSPGEWRFGLHNRENMNSSGSEAVKLGIAVQYGLVGDKWVHFCDAIVDDPKAMLACYDLQNGVTSWTDEHIKHVLALDAFFLATHIDKSFPRNERRMLVPFSLDKNLHTRYWNWINHVRTDLGRVENQIPFVLIDKVVKYITTFVASNTFESNEPLIGDLQYQQRSFEIIAERVAFSFMNTSGEAFKIDSSDLLGDKTHILGATYKVIIGSKGLLRESAWEETYLHVPSATKMEQSRINFVGVDGPLCTINFVGVDGPLCTMFHKKKCLYLPKVKLYEDTMPLLRNMAWYEHKNTSGGCMLNDYICLMADLIQAPKDLDLLIKCGVIDNGCGTRGFEKWITLYENLVNIPSSQIHHDMKVAIVSRCTLRRYRLWSEFKIVFCSKPWLVLSTIAVVLVTMATLVQTYIAITGSDKMKPKFP